MSFFCGADEMYGGRKSVCVFCRHHHQQDRELLDECPVAVFLRVWPEPQHECVFGNLEAEQAVILTHCNTKSGNRNKLSDVVTSLGKTSPQFVVCRLQARKGRKQVLCVLRSLRSLQMRLLSAMNVRPVSEWRGTSTASNHRNGQKMGEKESGFHSS